jgi:putative transposase
VAFVVDVLARRIVGWRVADSMHTEPVPDGLEQALWSRKVGEGQVHHGDRGSQYRFIRCPDRLAEAGIQPSAGSVGDSSDNALAETVIGLRIGKITWLLADGLAYRRRGCWRLETETSRWRNAMDLLS